MVQRCVTDTGREVLLFSMVHKKHATRSSFAGSLSALPRGHVRSRTVLFRSPSSDYFSDDDYYYY